MTQVIKIRKGKQTAEVVDRYVGDFEKDGWVRVGEYTDEVGAQSTKEAEKIAQEKSLHDAELQLKEAREAKEREEAGRLKAEREVQDLERKHQQDAINHSRGNIDHARNIADLKTKDEVADYVEQNFHKELDKRGSLEVVKERAVILSREPV